MREYLSIRKASLPWTRSWKAENLKVIGFLQEQQHRLIIGAGWSEVESQAVRSSEPDLRRFEC
jgi:hypothetical protein